MIETINGVMNTFFVIILATLFFKCFFKSSRRRVFPTAIAYILWFTISVAIAYFFDGMFPLKIFLVCICHTAANSVLFDSTSIVKRFVFSFLYVTLGIVCDYLMLIILEVLMPQYDYYNFLESPVGMTVGTFSLLMQFVIIIILSRFFDYSGTKIIDNKLLLKFILTPVLSLMFITMSILDYNAQVSSRRADATVFLALLIMFLNLSMYYILQTVIISERDKAENQLLLEQGRHYANYYRHMVEEKEEQKARAHDYVNHLKAIQDLGRKGDLKAQEEYIEEQIRAVSHSQDTFETGSPIVDAVINRKYSEAVNKGIAFEFAADSLSVIKISNSDLVTILSNILDNAIEAAVKCDDKKITLKTKIAGDVLFIDSTNTMLPVDNKGKRLKTTKTDKINHGYGLANIKKAVDNNGGQCIINIEGRLFHISVVIPCS